MIFFFPLGRHHVDEKMEESIVRETNTRIRIAIVTSLPQILSLAMVVAVLITMEVVLFGEELLSVDIPLPNSVSRVLSSLGDSYFVVVLDMSMSLG